MPDTRNKKKKEIQSDNRTYDVVGEKVNTLNQNLCFLTLEERYHFGWLSFLDAEGFYPFAYKFYFMLTIFFNQKYFLNMSYNCFLFKVKYSIRALYFS